MAIMYITHDLGVIAETAEEVVVMYLGKVVERADVDSLFYDPQHPYTRALLKSSPELAKSRGSGWSPSRGWFPTPMPSPAGVPSILAARRSFLVCATGRIRPGSRWGQGIGPDAICSPEEPVPLV